MAKPSIPRTRHQKGHAWATVTLVACGAFTLYANVRSGQLAAEPIVISAFPPIVAFLTSKLIAYFSPKTKVAKIFVYGGFGVICAIAMGASGFHIVDTVVRNGQTWYIGLMYIFIADAPMLLAAGILVQKVPTGLTTQNQPKSVQVPATQTAPTKTTKPAVKKATPAKTTKPRNATKPNILNDPFEKEMLTA